MKRAYLWIAIGALFLAVTVAAQTASDYDALVQKGKTQLQAGSADLALASGEAAIKVNPDRWEAYALAGGALMNLKRYEAAVDMLSHAVDRAPEAKQAALRDLRRQCLMAESGTTPAPKETAPSATTTQAEIVLWKSIENSGNPKDFQAYLDEYPQGAFVVLAKQHMQDAEDRQNKSAEEQARKAGTTYYPKPEADKNQGPSLGETMKFIQDTLTQVGKVNYVFYFHDNLKGKDHADHIGVEVSNVIADVSSCKISYHLKWSNGGFNSKKDFEISLRDVRDLVVETEEQHENEGNKKEGHPELTARVDPQVWRLAVDRAGNQGKVFRLYEEETANRLSKAMLHAVELCGGGQKEAGPF